MTVLDYIKTVPTWLWVIIIISVVVLIILVVINNIKKQQKKIDDLTKDRELNYIEDHAR